jgi:membrane protease YdiL (CAAX protease family)
MVVSLGMNEAFRVAYRSSAALADWVNGHSHLAQNSFHILEACMWVSVAYLCAGAGPLNAFARGAGVAKRPTFPGWFCAWGGIGLGLVELALVEKGWVKESLSGRKAFFGGQGVWLPYVVLSTLLSPFVEELVMRGFLYRAFRGSFGLAPSIALVLGFQTYFHLGLVLRDAAASLLMLTSGAVLCVMRERTNSTWNCVLFHSVYNATVLRQWRLSVIGMILLLPLCGRRAGEALCQAAGPAASADPGPARETVAAPPER